MNAFTVDLDSEHRHIPVRVGIECRVAEGKPAITLGVGWGVPSVFIPFCLDNPPALTAVCSCDQVLRTTTLNTRQLDGQSHYWLSRAMDGLRPDIKDKRCLVKVRFCPTWPGQSSQDYSREYRHTSMVIRSNQEHLSGHSIVCWNVLAVLDQDEWMEIKIGGCLLYLVCMQSKKNGPFKLDVVDACRFAALNLPGSPGDSGITQV